MPELKIKNEGPGKKTVVTNINEILDSWKKHPIEPLIAHLHTKGVHAQYQGETKKLVINGIYNQSELMKQFTDYIEMYILCPKAECRLPEIQIIISKDHLQSDCDACGHIQVIKANEKVI